MKKLHNQKGQTALEFTLVLPFFLLMMFTVLLMCLRVFYAELNLYAAFVGERAAMVGASTSDARAAAQGILPQTNLSISKGEASLTTTSTYNLESIIGQSGRNDLDSPLTNTVQLNTQLDTVLFIDCTSAGPSDDNPVGSGSC